MSCVAHDWIGAFVTPLIYNALRNGLSQSAQKTFHIVRVGPGPACFWSRSPAFLDQVQYVFGRGRILGLGPGPQHVPLMALEATLIGPGPATKIGPRPKPAASNHVIHSAKMERVITEGYFFGPNPSATTLSISAHTFQTKKPPGKIRTASVCIAE